jgi:hypothetical protein
VPAGSNPRGQLFPRAVDIAALLALKLAIGAWVLRLGFSHVSDDDFARTVISERFAHIPRLDPSGTSWLPLPFWIEGATMAAAGRTLAVARATAIALSAIAGAAPYLAMRTVGTPRAVAFVGTATAMSLPWNAWLGVATVPEGWTGAIAGASVIAMGNGRARLWAAVGLLVASLSRYEAWPAAAVLVALSLAHLVRGGNVRRELSSALIAAAGPLAWMAWNAHAHGSPFHFVYRVTAFRHAIGAADLPLRDKLLGYPRALATETPEVLVLGIAGVLGLILSSRLRARWRWAAIACAAILAFLIVGDVRDGAPTHHPARALSPLWWVLVGMGVDAVGAAIVSREWGRKSRVAAACAALTVGTSFCASMPPRWAAAPGLGIAERRDAQIARGLDLRDRGVQGADVTPCAFEHFAFIAAWGEPERARIGDRSGDVTGADCPRVVEW